MRLKVNRQNIRILPDSKRVITRFFGHGDTKANSIISKIISLNDEEADTYLNNVLREFAKRHRNITKIFGRHYQNTRNRVCDLMGGQDNLSNSKKLLIGSYFTMEYSLESAALFNPSIVEHPNQCGLEVGQKRVVISFRATGESHISSIVFRSGIAEADGTITLDAQGNYISEAEIIKAHVYDKEEFKIILGEHNIQDNISREILEKFGDFFYFTELKGVVNDFQNSRELTLDEKKTITQIMWLARSHYEIVFSQDTDISERVIFPVSRTESNGVEDARFVRFEDLNGEVTYYATYTAYDGYTILPKVLETKDFYYFKNLPLHGDCTKDKNFAFFPKKINGKYAMLSRLDGVNQYIMFSNEINIWDKAELLQKPELGWELVQLGNCGSPIETKQGWLLIMHGVGPMRKYSIGAMLLDLYEPQKVIARLKEPLIVPNEDEREGYVPNVVYSCGSMVHNNNLIIPYAVSDHSSSFASINLDEVLNAME